MVDLTTNLTKRNNHMRQHREALQQATSKLHQPVRLLALNWNLEKPLAMVHRLCADRVFSRGENHQTLRADTVAKYHEDVIWQFIRDREELAVNEVNDIIDMEVEDSLEAALARAVDGCVQILGYEKPSQESIDEAVRVAQEYVPKAKKATEKGKKAPEPRYYGILPEIDLLDVISTRLDEAEDVPVNGKAFWRALVGNGRVTNRPHVTFVHQKNLPGQKELWGRCRAIHLMFDPPFFSFHLGHLLWNDKVMALTVEDFSLAASDDSTDAYAGQGHMFVSQLHEDIRNVLHITVGTANCNIQPVEAKALVEAWRKGERAGIGSLEIEGFPAKGRIKGLTY